MIHMNEDLSSKDIWLKIKKNIELVIRGQSPAIRKLMAAFASGGHVLMDDYPGTGKTTLAKALAFSINAGYKRIQFTPDLLPSDILGVSIFDRKKGDFHFHKGPIFTNILLADEINRASPRTQSALLEAMAESQVSIDGKMRRLDGELNKNLFFVIATQNPVESRGTYPLPEAQMDRFAIKFSLGYVDPDEEVNILDDHKNGQPIDRIKPCVSMKDILRMKKDVENIMITHELKRYIVDIVRKTRTAKGVEMGASPRASLSLMKGAQALALFDGLEFVTPDHIRELAIPVIAHRISLAPQAGFSGETPERIVSRILESIPAPA